MTILIVSPEQIAEDDKELCILVPPGPGTEQMAEEAKTSLGQDLAKRNWIVVIPIAPDGKAFFGKNATIIPELIGVLQKQYGTTNKKVLLAGISNGGIAALETARRQPMRFYGVIAVPGLIQSKNVSRLKNMPVFIRVGAKDELKWAEAYPSTVRQLKKAGAILDAKLLPNASHVFRVDWKDLDPWLNRISKKAKPQN